MPYGMKNAPATFQQLMNNITAGIKGCVTYIDDLVVYSASWKGHISQVKELLERFSSGNLVVNLAKCKFVKAQYLGYVIGQGSHRKLKLNLHASVPDLRTEKNYKDS